MAQAAVVDLLDEKDGGQGDTESVEEEIFFNERYMPIRGWGSPSLPTDRAAWTNHSGETRDRENWFLELGWEWEKGSDWKLEIHEGRTDKKGWSYAIDFPHEFTANKGMLDFVRRKRFTRKRTRKLGVRTQFVECWQNQRKVLKWSAPSLATDRWEWSNFHGTKEVKKDSLKLPDGFVWDGDWFLWVNPHETDHNGWSYASDFPSESWSATPGMQVVRRRMWYRKYRPIERTITEKPVKQHDYGMEFLYLPPPGVKNMSCDVCYATIIPEEGFWFCQRTPGQGYVECNICIKK